MSIFGELHMPRVRKPISPTLKGNVYLARVKHPILMKTVCFSLGGPSEAKRNTDALNAIFMNPALWHNPPRPPETPDSIYRQWMGRENTVKLHGKIPKRGETTLRVDSDEIARLTTENDALRTQLQAALDRIEAQGRELEHWRGKKTTKLPSPTLEKARMKFMKAYRAGMLGQKRGKIPDADAVKNIEWDLERLCKHFGEQTPADFIEGKEEDFSAWLHGLKNASGKVLSASRRMQIRIYGLMMLEHAGAKPDRKKIARPDMNASNRVNDTTRGNNGLINYLTRSEAEKVAAKLNQPWADMFRIQLSVGLRPDELLTLHRNNFSHDLSKLTLAPLVFSDEEEKIFILTLKTGSRDVPIPESVRGILKARLKIGDVLFPDRNGIAWTRPRQFNRQYRAALARAGSAARLRKKLDARIARRTCASWLMQENVSAEKIAKLLGNSPAMILKHYGDPDVMNMKLDGITNL